VSRLVRQLVVAASFATGVAIVGSSSDRIFAQQKSGAKAAKKSSDSQDTAATPQRRQQLPSEQRQLQQRLARMKHDRADAEASHSEAADARAESEQAISGANRRLRELADARRQVERQIGTLQDRGRGVGVRQSEQEQQLARLMRAQLALGQEIPWRRWIAGDSPSALARELRYMELAALARSRSITDLRDRREELQQLEVESRVKQAELAGIAQEEKQARVQLLRQQEARKQMLTRLSRQISGQRQTIVTLERDEQRLGSLVEQLTRLLAEQARRAAQARSTARPSTDASRAARNDPTTAPNIDPPPGSKAAALRERMRLPVKGDVIARFGATRKTEAGVNAPTWKGVLIRAPQGTDVRAVAAGRVVFADWLRGFGNLLIVDHGEGLLSVYGNNESLLRSVGDRIEADEVIAEVGNTGGNAESGLYFELRFEGRPIDPLKWAQAR
jgi:septal ring factor EnvC (AmiA/AmiB activator)